MAISPQRLTIYLYSAHRAVIFAIAQLSCFDSHSLYMFVLRPPTVPVRPSVCLGPAQQLEIRASRKYFLQLSARYSVTA